MKEVEVIETAIAPRADAIISFIEEKTQLTISIENNTASLRYLLRDSRKDTYPNLGYLVGSLRLTFGSN
jgi:hypothetical protein